MNLKQFDKVMALVEDIDRGELPGFKRECDDAFQLEVGARCLVEPGYL